jgi:hypothetical protein
MAPSLSQSTLHAPILIGARLRATDRLEPIVLCCRYTVEPPSPGAGAWDHFLPPPELSASPGTATPGKRDHYPVSQYLPGAPTLHIRGMCMSRTSMGKRQSILDAGCQLQNLIQRPHPTLPQTCLSSAPVTHRICRQPVALLFSAPSVHTWVCSYLCRKNSTLLP